MYHLLVGEIENQDERDNAIKLLNKNGIQAVIQYYPLYKYSLFKSFGINIPGLPNTEKFYASMISLPFSTIMTDHELEKVGSAIQNIPHL